MQTKNSTAMCPCCGDDMNAANVVCWHCYRLTNRLTPGNHPGLETELGWATISRWQTQRRTRLAAAAGAR